MKPPMVRVLVIACTHARTHAYSFSRSARVCVWIYATTYLNDALTISVFFPPIFSYYHYPACPGLICCHCSHVEGDYTLTVTSPYQDNSVLESWSIKLFGSCVGEGCDDEPSTVHFLTTSNPKVETVTTSTSTAQNYGGTTKYNEKDSTGIPDVDTQSNNKNNAVTTSAAASALSPFTTPTSWTSVPTNYGLDDEQQRHHPQEEDDNKGSPKSTESSSASAGSGSILLAFNAVGRIIPLGPAAAAIAACIL